MAWMLVAVVLGAGRWGTGPAGCGRWSVLGGFLCWFVVGEGVLVLCWVLGSLMLPTVSLLVPGVSAGEGVVASGLGVGGGAGVGVVVPGPGVGRGRSSVAGCGRSPLLAEGLVGPPLCPSGVSGGPAAPVAGGVAGFFLFGFVCVAFVVRAALALWCVVCVCGARVGGGCGGVCCVHARACVRCVGGAFGCLSSPFWAWFGGSVWCGGCVSWPLSRLGCVVPRPPWLGSVGGVSPCCPLCVPSSFCLFSVSLGAVFPWCRARAFPAVVAGGGSLSSARVPSPGVSPWGGRCLHSPSGCNSVVRAVHLYPLGTNGPAP